MEASFFTKKRMSGRISSMEQVRTPHMSDWSKITEVIRPNRGLYLPGGSDTSKRPTSMVNSSPHVASRTLQAGMISGASSPSYEWFKFYLDDPGMMEWGPARIALEQRERIMYTALARSNFYQNLQVCYGDGADFGTGCGIIDEHPRDLFAAKLFAPGEYSIDTDEIGDINAVSRKFSLNSVNLIQRYGKEKVSDKVSQAYSNGDYTTKFPCCELIEANLEHEEGKELEWRSRPWVRFAWEESNAEDGENNFLEISGYHDWPGFNLRWDLSSGNRWGFGPGLVALGDAVALQTLEFRDAQAVEKAVKPSLQAPIFLRNQNVSQAPGGLTYYDPFASNGAKVEPIYQIQPGILQALITKIESKERRVNEVYFKDLFLMLATTDRREITAREVEEKHGEKLLALGPVLQRTHRDALSNSIIRIYQILDRAGVFPPAPAELTSRLLSIRYTSALAYAQRAAGAASLERFFGFSGNLVQVYPDVKHKVNIFKGLDYYADAIGVPAEVMVPTDEAKKNAAAEAQAANAPAQADAMATAAGAAKSLSETDTSRPSALSFLMNRAGVAA